MMYVSALEPDGPAIASKPYKVITSQIRPFTRGNRCMQCKLLCKKLVHTGLTKDWYYSNVSMRSATLQTCRERACKDSLSHG